MSVAEAPIVTERETVDPFKGLVRATAGAVASGAAGELLTLTVRDADAELPLVSYAFTITVCEPLVKLDVFNEKENDVDVVVE